VRKRDPRVDTSIDRAADCARAPTTVDHFSPSHPKEYIEWITGAKTDETRARRVKTAVEQMAEGTSQNWKYERKKSAGTRRRAD
jgi:uncharacterized protein YdeI (YjbR/CyaY-like superfamily)